MATAKRVSVKKPAAGKTAAKRKTVSKAAAKSTRKQVAGSKQAAPVAARREGSTLTTLRDEIDRVFDRFTHHWPGFSGQADWDPFNDIHFPSRLSGIDLSPKVDIAETNGGFKVTVELPGLSEDDVEVTLTDGTLVIKGEKRDERDRDEDDYHITERSFGSFRRSFRVPDGVDINKVDARFDKGVLTVTLPKTAQAKSRARKISVQRHA